MPRLQRPHLIIVLSFESEEELNELQNECTPTEPMSGTPVDITDQMKATQSEMSEYDEFSRILAQLCKETNKFTGLIGTAMFFTRKSIMDWHKSHVWLAFYFYTLAFILGMTALFLHLNLGELFSVFISFLKELLGDLRLRRRRQSHFGGSLAFAL